MGVEIVEFIVVLGHDNLHIVLFESGRVNPCDDVFEQKTQVIFFLIERFLLRRFILH
jgi:hypothetical protein